MNTPSRTTCVRGYDRNMDPGSRAMALAGAVLVAACGTPRLVANRQESAASGKPLVVEFHADWCQPCKRFEHDVLPDPRVQLSLSGVMFERYDIDNARRQRFMSLRVDSDGNETVLPRNRGGAISLTMGNAADNI